MAEETRGRKTVFTPEVCKKIEEVAALDGSISEMAYYADVSRQSIYNYFKENPDFLDRIEKLREKPVLLARQTIIKSLTQPHNAFKYVERKRAKEWAPQTKVEHSGAIDTPVTKDQIAPLVLESLREEFETRLRESIVTVSKEAGKGQNATNRPMIEIGDRVTPHTGPLLIQAQGGSA